MDICLDTATDALPTDRRPVLSHHLCAAFPCAAASTSRSSTASEQHAGSIFPQLWLPPIVHTHSSIWPPVFPAFLMFNHAPAPARRVVLLQRKLPQLFSMPLLLRRKSCTGAFIQLCFLTDNHWAGCAAVCIKPMLRQLLTPTICTNAWTFFAMHTLASNQTVLSIQPTHVRVLCKSAWMDGGVGL